MAPPLRLRLRRPLPALSAAFAFAVLVPPPLAAAQDNLKYKFFCGSSFKDIQSDTCADRQWCPTSSDDECLVPGHTCFAGTPCDAREVPNVSVPTYSLSQHPEYRDPGDKMFCGTDYGEALRTCEAGGDAAVARHCPDDDCPAGQTCYLDLPCSYFVLTDPTANPFANVGQVAVEAWEVDLPLPGSMESHYFCGATFQEAAAACSSRTWCRTGTNQECPNGETCFVSVDVQNAACEINAIKKAEYELAKANSRAPSPSAALANTPRPTNAPLRSNDPKNRMFCGLDWNDASNNCARERFCPNGDADCAPLGMKCFDYTRCDAVGMTASPTGMPTSPPTERPTPSPINTTPTQLPTTAKPSKEPTKQPTGVPTPKPTGVPSKKPTHAPLAYGDYRREFWCGHNYWDAVNHCAAKCPSGEDVECPGELKCMSGVTNCKNEMGLAAYDDAPADDGAGPTGKPTEAFHSLGGKQTASKPKPSGTAASGTAASPADDVAGSAVDDDASAASEQLPLQGPFYEGMVRIILYGLDATLSGASLQRWKIMTTNYMENFFNKYPTEQMLAAGDVGQDTIRNSVFDVSVEISEEVVEMAPMHDFNSLAVGGEVQVANLRNEQSRSLRSRGNISSNINDDGDNNSNVTWQSLRRTQGAGIDPDKMVMITFVQTSQYRTFLDVINDNPSQLIMRRPLETPEYRAEYVSYLRSADFATFGNLEYASRLMYTEFPTSAPTDLPTPAPSDPPVVVGEPTRPPFTDAPTTPLPTTFPPTPNPTEKFGCNLCTPGQYGVNANVIFNGEVSTCMEVYNWFLKNYQEGSGGCRQGEEQLSHICCRDADTPPDVAAAPKPAPQNDPPSPPTPSEPGTPRPTPDPTPRPTPKPTPRPTRKAPTAKPTDILEIAVDENGLPDAASLAETYYCGKNWDMVDCSTASPCPDGTTSDCGDDEQCIAFTNCGGKFAFVSDPRVEGGGPDPEEVRSTFYCGTSMQFLNNVCDGATPCPNGPTDCEGDGETFGCFAFTGCNEQVNPGKFVGFLKPPDEDDVNGQVPQHSAANSFFCAATWAELDNSCEDGVPKGMRPCPSGDILECEDGHGCFAFACGGGLPAAGQTQPAASPSEAREYSVEDMDLLKSTFFCGTSIEQIDGDCENAIPCPSGDECPEGYGCFAFSQCGGIDIESLVDTFGNTDRPTRAPTVPIEQICDEGRKMSVNVGYWQSWSIYRDEDCQQMNTATFDAAPYTHVVYSFASIDASYRLEAWNGTYDNEVPLYREFQTVKQRHPGTKTMIAVGGWTHNDPGPMQKRFSQMAASKSNRQTFANSVVQFMRTYGFDGLDLDWEYPGLKERGGKREDYDNYVLMTKELREAFNRAPEPFELTVAITGNITKLEMGFDLVGLAKYVDWFNIMAYDLWGSWDPKQIAYSHTDLRMIDEAVEYMSHFIQRSKLVLGLGSYARTYTLSDEDCVDLGCPFEGPGKSGCEGTDGFLPYFEIADLVTTRQYDTVRYDDDSHSMVMITDGNRLISYDNSVSFNRKIQYAEEMCFMGDMLWAIDMLKQGSNPLSSNRGNSAATGDASDQSFCGKDYQDVISGCKQPCPSGDSSQCPPGQFCFANSGCSIDNIGAPPPTKCRLCPDPSTQGMRDWLRVDFNGETMTCGEADLAVISEFAKGTEECDQAKQSLGDTCCYNYPDNPCMLCRSETEFMDLRAIEEIDYNGKNLTCFDLSKRLGPEENDSDMCMDAQKEFWDTCCYHQCTLCEGQGIKWWNEISYEDEPLNCGELDAMLYADETEVGTENCTAVLSSFKGDCCYDYPNDPCDVCKKENGDMHTLMPNEEVNYEGSTFTCAEVNNFLSPFESSSNQCGEVKDLAFDTCCFDRCSLCGEGARLDAEVLVDIDGEEGTCADVESALFQERTIDGSENCTESRSLHYDACCFEIPSSPCQLCATDEYMYHTAEIEFNDDEVTCKSASNFLMERHEMYSQTCSDAKAVLGETCCYSLCDMCGEYSLDWDVFVNFEGVGEMSCGDFNEYFREEAVVDGSEQCEELKGQFFDTCCYDSPTTSCQLCKQGETFFDLNDNVQVDFNGPTTCYEVANFMSRRTEDADPVCAVTQASLFDECCYEKCNLADKPGTYPDWSAEVEMDGNVATCLELEDAIKEAAISKDSPDCKSLQDAFSPTCSYSIPQNPCDICPSSAVSINFSAEWNGKELKCSDIKARISSREESEGEVCRDAQANLRDCCIDQCEVCEEGQKTDFALTVYHEGKTKQCTEVDDYFYEKSILASSVECQVAKSDHSTDCCYTPPQTPCNLCKRGESEYFDVMGTNSVNYMNQRMTCSDLSDMMLRREEEGGDSCSSTKEEFFEACCNTKCALCAGKGLEAGVKVSFEGRMMTCLELDMGLGPASIEAGSDQCMEIVSQHENDCCYEKPESPCRICPGETSGVKKQAKVTYLGTETTCESLSNFLGSREEQQGQACQTASADHGQDCCFERCSLCGEGKADWETFVTYEGQSIACGDFEWILKGMSIAAGSDQCNAVKDEFHDKCCYKPPETSCNLCHIDNNYLDVSSNAQINYQGSQMKCLSLYNSLFVREGADSNQCQSAKDEYGESCCFEKCNMCQVGFLDTTAKVNVDGIDLSCSALDMSFSKDVVREGTSLCSEKRAEYSNACCYTLPDTPCRLCPAGSNVIGDVSVDFYGESKTCQDIGNKLALSEEAGSQTCSMTQNEFSQACCFESCPICPTGYNLNWEVDVEYNRAQIACGEFDSIIRGNGIRMGTQECSSLRSTYSSACCYNYATAGGGAARETTLAQVVTRGYLDTNLDTSTLSPSQKEDAKFVFQNLIRNTLEKEGVLPLGSTVTVTDINDQGRVFYEIEMNIDDSAVSSVAAVQIPSTPPETSQLGDISNEAVTAIDSTLSNPTILEAIANEIKQEATQVSDPTVAEELSSVSVTDFTLEETILETTDNMGVATTGQLDTNIDTTGLSEAQRKEAIDTIEDSIVSALQNQGIITADDTITVTDIDGTGEVQYEVDLDTDDEVDSALDDLSNAIFSQLGLTLSTAETLAEITNQIKEASKVASDPAVAEELSTAELSGSSLSPDRMSVSADETTTEIIITGVLNTNIGTTNLSDDEKEEVKDAIEQSIENTLQDQGAISPTDEVTVIEIDDLSGEVMYEIDVIIPDSPVEAISNAVVAEFDSNLSKAETLVAISNEIKEESADVSDSAVAEELSTAVVTESSLSEDTTITRPGEFTEAGTSGTLDTSIDLSGLNDVQIEEVADVVENSIQTTLQNQGTISQNDKVTVTDINKEGDVEYEIDLNVDLEIDSALEDISTAVVAELVSTLSDPEALKEITNEIKQESSLLPNQNVAEELSQVDVSQSSLGETSISSSGGRNTVTSAGILSSNIDTASLTVEEKEQVREVVESSIENTLQNTGVLPEDDESVSVTVIDIDEEGDIEYQVDLTVRPETETPPPVETTTLEGISNAIVTQIDSTLSNPSILANMGDEIKAESADSSVAEELSTVEVVDFVQGETSVTSTGTATGAGPCNLCNAGEIGLSKQILFNGVQTSCPEVYKFLSTQAEAGSESCIAGKEALRQECCMKKCDFCSGGGIPDWYSMVAVNGNSMTCLELDGIVADSEIQSGSEQCSQLLEVAAPACCYEPPSKPCNMCQNGSEFNDVMTSVVVEYGGTKATCGQIFNTLFSREEHDSETCALIKQDLASQCCYNKCSLCGALQTNAALSVVHDDTQIGCSEFDSYIFASNLIEEGSNECIAFQDEHRENCCYDIACSLCAKGNDIFTTKEDSMVQYSGSEVACGEVANFLYQQEMSQDNACLAAQENIFSDCCFQQCELCEAGSSINWAAATVFNGQSQSCTDVYWLLVSESIEAGTQTCSALAPVSRDCCYQIPSQQCTLCKDDNGVTYNTRWNKEVTVNGITKTCGDFNTLLATQEDESQTCSMAKSEIFDDCCFAGSDTLVAIANQASTESDAPCSLCQPGQIGVSSAIVFNNNPTTCEEVYNFLIDSFKESSTTCKSAQVKLAEDCCRDPDELSPSDIPAFGGTISNSDNSSPAGEGSAMAEKPAEKPIGKEITPPKDFDFNTWTRLNGSKGNSSLGRLSRFFVGALSIGLVMMN